MASTLDPSCTTIRQVVEEFEAAIRKPPNIPVEILDPLTGPRTNPNQRGALSLSVRRESTRNLDLVRNQEHSHVEDIIVCEFQIRLSPKAQKVTRGEVFDVIDRVRNRLTNLTFRRQWNTKHLDTREQLRTGEHLTVFVRFETKRFETLGNE